jgi:hypothetical protein
MNKASFKVGLTLAVVAVLAVGWLSVVSMEQQQAHADACNIHQTNPLNQNPKETGNSCLSLPNGGANNQHYHIPNH